MRKDLPVALVTGSRRGIGREIAATLGRSGKTAVFSDILPEGQEIDQLLEEYRREGIACDYIQCDISCPSNREFLFDEILRRHGRIDILVNNAGVAPRKRMDLLETTVESMDFLLDVNLKGTFFMCQQAANVMIGLQARGVENYAPRIINISSISAYTSSTSRGEYCIAKAGVSMVTKLFADRLAQAGIPVFEVRPGIILTDMTAPVKEKYEKLIDEGVTPVRRFGQPKDVAACVEALCGGLMDFCTGQVLDADGGFHIRRL